MLLRTTDGTQLSYEWKGTDYQCTQIKDRNGNFIAINYTAFGRIGTVVDTLGRIITFNYDGSNTLTSITQNWNGQTHYWARFEYYPAAEIHTNFQGLTVVGPQNGSTIKELSKVTLADNSRSEFDYTYWGQVWKIRNYAADGHATNYRAYNLPGGWDAPQTDCPRFTIRVDWAENWNRGGSNGASGLPYGSEQEVSITYSMPTSASWNLPDGTPQTGMMAQVTAVDGTYIKIYFEGAAGTSNGWKRALTSLVETYGSSTPDGSIIKQRSAVTKWTQDNTSVSYVLNPRIEETNIYDFNSGGQVQNHLRTAVIYQTVTIGDGTSCRLPQDVYEYQANASTVLRHTHSTYNLESTYLNRRIIGLVSEKTLYEVDPSTQAETLMSKVGFQYDATGSIQGTDAPIQHDNTSYSANFFTGRANLTSVTRYDVTNSSQTTVSTLAYNTAGAVVKAVDPATHQTLISYTDQFSANGTTLDAARPATFAYPTMVTNPDGFTVSSRYQFDFGAITWKQTPLPNVTTNQGGPQQTLEYDNVGRLSRVTSLSNNAYTRFVYGPNYVETFASINTVADEAHSIEVFDGAGRSIASASNHPGSSGGFSGQLILFDRLGRLIKNSNPTETSVSISGVIQPYNWGAAGDDAYNAQTGQGGWLYTQQTYDWKGRPLVTTNPDGTTKEASYTGCGCAGGAVTTLTDEGTVSAGVAKKRQQRIYTDVLGRNVKTEALNWDGGGAYGTGGSVYTTTVTSYNARDQVRFVRQYQGLEGSATYQETSMTYDGFGRLKTKHSPEQQVDPNNSASTDHTTWTYKVDDMIESLTDARGATTSYSYNNRHQITGLGFVAPSGIAATSAVSFAYDAAGNRTLMTDGSGSTSYQYDQLSRLSAETKHFNDYIPQAPLANNNFTISYDYNLAGQLKTLTAPYGEQINYAIDNAGRITGVTGPLYSWSSGPQSYVSNVKYRAWGGFKSADYLNANGFGLNCNAGISVSQTFDNRLRTSSYHVYENPSQYCTTGSLLRKEYQYYDDGSPRYVKDMLNGAFDRSHEYDQQSRVAKVRTAAEAQGTGSTFNYRQNYSYDVWSNTLSRQMTTPSSDETQTYTYTNNRATAVVNNQATPWQYDADGMVVNDTHTMYSNDAAGDVIGTQVTGEYVMARTNDGDGLTVKQAVGETNPDVPLYLVRSTVLDGEMITQLPASAVAGAPRSFVYAFGKILVTVARNGGSEAVAWQFREPSGTTVLDDDGGYHTYRRMEMDPAGAIVYDDYLADPPPNQGGGYLDSWTLGLEGLGGSPFGGSSCFRDGFEANCASVMQSLQNDTVAQCRNNNCSPININGVWAVFIGSGYWFSDGHDSEYGFFDELQYGSLLDAYSLNFRGPDKKRRQRQVNRVSLSGGLNFGPITPDQLKFANTAVAARYDDCKSKWFGNRGALGSRLVPGRDATRLSLAAGMNNSEIATRVAGIFSQESNFSLDPGKWGNDAGPAQLTGSVLIHWPWALVDDAFGTRLVRNSKGQLAINNKGQWDGSNFDNMATLRNIAISYRSAYDLAYEWGPGSRVSAKENARVRNEYAQDVTSRTPTYKNFFDCLLGKN